MNQTPKPLPNLNELSQKAQTIYNEIPKNNIRGNEGKYVAIEIDSKEYFIGGTREEAVDKAKAKYPDKIVFVRRIGPIEKISIHASASLGSLSTENARLF